ncbi:hypothetical protein BVX98_07045 [bacterium F11]|nr:hypothetical protein BVX98_07045 [bacterium F11]
MKKVTTIILLFLFSLGACSPTRLFFYPNRVLYLDPHDVDIQFNVHKVKSLNGREIVALEFQTKMEPKGVVVHFHGNFGNVSNHFTQAYFLVNYGYDVLTFDYQGFGASDGKPSPLNIIEDGIAIVRFAEGKKRNPKGGVVVFGQSIGGAAALVTAVKEPLVKGAIIESTFTRYRSMARYAMSKSLLLWIFYPFYPFLLPRKYDPIHHIPNLSPRPLLLVHGENDRVIPVKMSKKLFRKANEPKELMIVKKAGHLGCRRANNKTYDDKFVDFIDSALGIKSNDESK